VVPAVSAAASRARKSDPRFVTSSSRDASRKCSTSCTASWGGSRSSAGGGSPSGSGQVYAYLDALDISSVPIVSGQSTCNSVLNPACSTIDIGLGQQANGGTSGSDGFVGRYPVNNAKPTWVDRLSGPGMDTLTWVADGPTATFFVSGWYDQSTSFIDSTKTVAIPNAGDRDIFLASINPETGTSNFITTFSDTAFEQPVTVAWNGSELLMSGFVAGVDVTAFGVPKRATQGFDWFVAKLSGSGTPIWWIVLGGAGNDKYPSMVLDAAGDIYLAGTVDGSADFGTYKVGGAGGTDVAVVKLKGSDGSVVWAKSFGSTGDDTAGTIALNGNGQLLVSALVSGPITTNGKWNGDLDGAFVSYDTNGNMRWSKVLGTSGSDFGGNVAAASDGFYAIMNYGADIGPTIEGVPVQGAPQPTGVLMKIQP